MKLMEQLSDKNPAYNLGMMLTLIWKFQVIETRLSNEHN